VLLAIERAVATIRSSDPGEVWHTHHLAAGCASDRGQPPACARISCDSEV